jgi:ClpP class serine protease
MTNEADLEDIKTLEGRELGKRVADSLQGLIDALGQFETALQKARQGPAISNEE